MMKIEKFLYYERVRHCCRFADSISSDKQSILEVSVCFNKVLDVPYQITEQDSAAFVSFFMAYRAWLLEKFMDPHFSFSSHYPNFFSFKDRKHWNISDFEAVYGNVSKESLFFAQTFYDFSSHFLDGKDDQLLVPHKMRLGSILMLVLIGCSGLSSNAELDKTIILNLQAAV